SPPVPVTERSLGLAEQPRATAMPRRLIQLKRHTLTPILRILSTPTGGVKKTSGTGSPRSLLPAGLEDRLPHLFTGCIVGSRKGSRKEINLLPLPHGEGFAKIIPIVIPAHKGDSSGRQSTNFQAFLLRFPLPPSLRQAGRQARFERRG